jgi:hypothetical protein
MRTSAAIIIGAILISISILVANHWQIAAGGTTGAALRLNQWTGAVEFCVVQPGYELSQEALAHAASLNRTYLSAVERNVSIDNIGRIAKGLRVEAWTLLRG